MNTLYQELNTLSNRDLAQVSQACNLRVRGMAEQILCERLGPVFGNEPQPGTRLSTIYLRHLDTTFG
jgi:hypothetical protein